MNLYEKIETKIKQENYLTFDKYMEMALYEPDYGYYDNPQTSLDPNNCDFITSPELTRLFGASIYNFFLKILKNHSYRNFTEFGAGSGKLAYDILCEDLDNNYITNYYIVEKSKKLINDQKRNLSNLPGSIYKKVKWVKDASDISSSFFLANEVFDAMPVKIFKVINNNYFEKVIRINNNTLIYDFIKAKTSFIQEIEKIQKNIGLSFPNNYESEISFKSEEFIVKNFKNKKDFIFLIIDYGYGQNEYYHIQKKQGNIQYYYKKNKVIDCLAFSGNVDISCNVDFSQIYKIFNNLNHNLVSYTTQKDFLIYCDILKQADQICDELKRNSVLKTLLFPTDMGETFKIMLVSNKTFRNSFDINDIRHKL
ncbi:MAG: hypothetical protein CMD47_03800 [Gammaproteobacteria bacterium]|nr:hypothetical protein [Gammaproteobacteria bacterium]